MNTVSISEYVPTMTLPAVECAPWCQDGDGHTDALFVGDQFCMSETQRLELRAEQLQGFGQDEYGRSVLDVALSRKAYSTRTLVDLVHSDRHQISLTIDEAEALAAELDRLVKAARS